MAVRVKSGLNKKTCAAVIAVILAAVLIAVIVFSSVSNREIEYYDFQKNVAQGIDVSEHNGKIDWDTVSNNADFAFIRAGYRGYGTGEIKEDENARENIKGAHKAGVPFGVYFYSQAVNPEEAREEAKFVLKLIRYCKPELPVVIDFEYPVDEDGQKTGRMSDADLSAEESTQIINAFCEEIQDKNLACGLYASSSVMFNEINMKDLVKDTAVWVAEYNDSVSYDVDYKIWQYSRTGTCDGVSSKNVDLNYYYSKIQRS